VLSFVVVNVIVVDTFFRVVQNGGAGPSAELGPVLNAKDIVVGNTPIKDYEPFSVCDILAQAVIWDDSFGHRGSVVNHGDSHWDGRTWKYRANVQAIMWMANTEIAQGGFIAFVQYRGNYIPLNASGWSFSGVY